MKLFWAILLLSLATATADAQALAPPTPTEPERWEWSGQLPAGQPLRVVNLFGDIRARFGGSQSAVEIHAVIQNLHPGTPPLRVRPESDSEGTIIKVGRATGPVEVPQATPQDRVDLVVWVPKGVPLTAVTRTGAIEVKGLKGDVYAESESGAIALRGVEGLLKTLNRYGATDVTLEPLSGLAEQTFESLTGDITVTLPARADITVVAQTSAWITTDISLQIIRNALAEPSKTATGKVGSGASRIAIRTKRGSVQIFQMEDFRGPPTSTQDQMPLPGKAGETRSLP